MGNINTDFLNQLIVGRVEPHIYAFSTKTVPDYLKVGDTYRPVEKRLNEWRAYFPNLEKKFCDVAKVDEETFFRDFAIHSYLENERKRIRLKKDSFPNLPYYSNEFFKDACIDDVKDAITEIKCSHSRNDGKYSFYKFDTSRIPLDFKWARTEDYKPRNNQQTAIDNFNKALKNGRTNLLMYAVMRFGKSFTSMCCAAEIDAKFVVIVSAKADVKAEWKKTVESHKRFDGYEFLDSTNLQRNEIAITQNLKTSRVVLFLTLQDLQGDAIKAKHKEVFENNIDLLLIDETHFGARGNEYGKVLREVGLNKTQQKEELKQSDEDLGTLYQSIKFLNAKVRIHLSGTPYRILMGSEFTEDDIIAFCQFSDIVDEQEKWNNDNLDKDDVKEWDNPYFGFPQMVRFAFNPNESSIKKMEELRKSGITYTFSALFKPQSITKDIQSNKHQRFIHEQEVLDLLKVIDGSKEDDNLLGFLDYPKIQEGKMCRHIVCVLPFCASCDALQSLIINNKDIFKNLKDYEIINISGVDDQRTYKTTESVKSKIRECESSGGKTLTLTVNRMLTGSTIEEWDTMLYFKDTASPQEYDQAIFRLQNPYIQTYKDDKGDTIKYNMKPQTLLVDFDPCRMFRMQEEKSQIYNVNVEQNGNDKLEERIRRELEISPIVVLNHNKIQQVTPTDILLAVSEYSSDKCVADEATAIPVDLSLLADNEIKKEIERQAEINSKDGLKTKAVEGEGDDIEGLDGQQSGNNASNDEPAAEGQNSNNVDEDSKINSIRKKFATYYSRILFFAFLTHSNVKSIQGVLSAIDENINNARIAKNLEINKHILELIQQKMSSFILSKLDYKIQNLNNLANDISLPPLERAHNAMRKFGRISESEIVTPSKIADEMVSILPAEEITADVKLLDIASKQGEFAIALVKRFGDKVKKNIYSITTSIAAYEFTHKIYEILGMPINNIFKDFNSFDIIGDNNEEIIKKLQNMKFKAIVGNPPYQVMDGGNKSSAIPIYDKFVIIAKQLHSKYISMIIPAKWYNGGRGLNDFRNNMLNDNSISKLVDYSDSNDCFNGVDIAGGICYFLWDNSYSGLCSVINNHNGKRIMKERSLSEHKTFIRHSEAISIINKISSQSTLFMNSQVSSQKPFGLRTYVMPSKNGDIVLRYRGGKGPYSRAKINTGIEWIDKWKIITSYLTYDHAGRADKNGMKRIISTMEILSPKEICTETYLVLSSFNSEFEATNCMVYIKSKFTRFLIAILTSTQHLSKANFAFVPIQDFTSNFDIDWTKSVAEIDRQLYAKYGLTDTEIAFIESNIKPME